MRKFRRRYRGETIELVGGEGGREGGREDIESDP